MSKKSPQKEQLYSVRVLRVYAEEFSDIEVMASSPEEANEKAIEEAKQHEDLYFGEPSRGEFELDFSMDPEIIE